MPGTLSKGDLSSRVGGRWPRPARASSSPSECEPRRGCLSGWKLLCPLGRIYPQIEADHYRFCYRRLTTGFRGGQFNARPGVRFNATPGGDLTHADRSRAERSSFSVGCSLPVLAAQGGQYHSQILLIVAVLLPGIVRVGIKLVVVAKFRVRAHPFLPCLFAKNISVTAGTRQV